MTADEFPIDCSGSENQRATCLCTPHATGVDETIDQWFAQEILVHEDILVRYLRRTWSRREEVFDIRQDTYVRVYEAALVSRPASPKAFLFATARNLMADRIRHERVVSIEVRGDLESLNVSMEAPGPSEQAGTWQELRSLAEGLDTLPLRCREVVWLNKVEELTYRQVAERLGITLKTVEKQVSKGLRRLADHYWAHSMEGGQASGSDKAGDRETPHA